MRPGHHRPIGTTTTMRFVWDSDDGDTPQLGDCLVQVTAKDARDENAVRRGYLVVGLIEGRDVRHFRLVLERVAWPPVNDRYFRYYNLPRSPK
jgi:hypothetical protein